MRFVIPACLTVIGFGFIFVAVANLYNVDRQPRSLLLACAVVGSLALIVAFVLARRGSKTSTPPR